MDTPQDHYLHLQTASIYGDFTGRPRTIEQAQNLLVMADIARDSQLRLTQADMLIERSAFLMANRTRRTKR